jgi:hypothetical protein
VNDELKEHIGATCLSIAVLTPLGFYSKFYHGPAQTWVNNSLGGAFYVIFWCLLVYLFLPRARPLSIAAGVLAATCALETLQLWHPSFLERLRDHFLGATILGTYFTWSDFPYYFLGAVAGWAWMAAIQRRVGRKHS